MSSQILNHKLAVVLPTKDRPQELTRLLSSIEAQTHPPDQIIIADGGEHTMESVIEQFPQLHIDHIKIRPPGLTKQKNAGTYAVKPGIDLIGFIDDDIVLENGAFAAMLAFWANAGDDLAGACFNITNATPADSRLKSLLKSIFFIDNREFGNVSRSGCITPIWDAPQTRTVRWLGGGYTVWRKEVFDRWRFDEWFPANGLLEDVQFSYQVGKEYGLAVVAEARAAHVEGPVQMKGQVVLGRRQMTNWVYFVRSHRDLSNLMCLWSCVGRLAVNLTLGFGHLDPKLMARAFGNSVGLAMVAAGFINPLRNSSKWADSSQGKTEYSS